MTIYHQHHIVPKHMGGSDDPSNLVELTIEEHAQAHLELYQEHGYEQDLVAHRMLLGQIDQAEAIKILQKAPKSERWKKKASERNKGEGNPMWGKSQTKKQKEAVRKANSVPKPHLRDLYKKRYAEGNHNVPIMKGSDNPRARKVYAEGVIYDTVKECRLAYGFKYNASVGYRCRNDKFKDWYYIE